jgi:hypothetical protein
MRLLLLFPLRSDGSAWTAGCCCDTAGKPHGAGELSMRAVLAALAMAISPLSAPAALSPVFQNERDLNVMVDFVRSHPFVLESLRSVDLEQRVIRYGDACKAQFDRPRSTITMPGASPSLQFIGSNCPIYPAKKTRAN